MSRALAVVLAPALALSAAAPALADLPELKARGVLRVVVAAEEAPETFDPRTESGFERELIGTFAHANGLRLEVVVAKTHPERIDLLLAGRGDLIAAIFDTPERRQRVAFTSEVMPTYNLSATLAPRPAVASLEDLRRLRVGVVKGTATAEDPAVAAIASLHRYESKEAMLAALRSGTVDALVMPVSELALASEKLPGLQPGVQVGSLGSSAWAVRKEDAALRTALDQHLEYVRKSAAWNRLLVKYFGERAPMVLGRRR
ncbi:MAG TPA: transporter substrate-binding domain-containing protein [Vicinamibacteria bacterium]|nr:transporter substrate-binding domain-containing protein [Vicinamibacteria bacterium]